MNDLSRSLNPLEPDGTLIAVIEMSQSSWLVAGIVPGVERQPLKKLSVDESALLKLLQRWREEAELTDTVEKDFEGATSATLIQGERRTSNIDSKIHLLGFDCFTIQFHRSILDTFSTVSVESRCGAVAVGRTYLLPPLSSGGASMAPPWLRFHIPLIEPDRQISRIRLSDKTSRFRVQRHLQLLDIYRS